MASLSSLSTNFTASRWTVLGILLSLIAGPSVAQLMTKPPMKGFTGRDYPPKIYDDVKAACDFALSNEIGSETSSHTGQCGFVDGAPNYITQTTTNLRINRGYRLSVTNPSKFACMLEFYQLNVIAGNGKPCGVTTGTWENSNTVERQFVTEVRVCDRAGGWHQWSTDACIKGTDQYPSSPDQPKCGNPTNSGTGCKEETILLGTLPSGSARIPVELRYGNLHYSAGAAMLGEPSWFLEPADRRLNLSRLSSYSRPAVIAIRGHGVSEEFQRQTDGTFKSFDSMVTLTQQAVANAAWRRTDFRSGYVEDFDSSGRLVMLRFFRGGGFSLGYSGLTSFPTQLTTATGQTISFAYANGRLDSVAMPDGRTIVLGYRTYEDSGRHIRGTYLNAVNFPDGRMVEFDYAPGVTLSPVSFHDYGDGTAGTSTLSTGLDVWQVMPNASGGAAHPWNDVRRLDRAFFNLSTKIDERGLPYAFFEYDNNGRVTTSRHAGNVFRHEFTYSNGQNVVKHPMGATTTFGSTRSSEQMRLAYVSRSSPDLQNGVHSVSRSYDLLGNLTRESDSGVNNGSDYRTKCYKNDSGTGMPSVLLEGSGSASCPADLSTYSPQGVERKVSFQRHPTLRLPSRIAEPGRITTLVYNGQPDPFAGGSVASCAPSAAVLPDGTAIAVICKQVEQATTDVSGGLGFAAVFAQGIVPRTNTWTYDQFGQVLSHDGPRLDVQDVTTYEYHMATAFTGADPSAVGASTGDLKRVVQAGGESIQYRLYDKLGQLLESEDANGVVSRYTYDARQRLTSVSVADEVTTFEYWSTGHLKRTTNPDASWVQYDYDAAQRLTSVSDNVGNTVVYTLDSAGNRVSEQFTDPGGALRRQLQRSTDTLGRVRQITGRE